jgi:ergothioneine biosynthesis protein EgtC
MCRLLAYLGDPIPLEKLLYDPQHSLVVQSYQPREMTGALLNADGFGVGWYGSDRSEPPYSYRHTIPIWNDVNLPSLSRYITSDCILANVRSATPGLAVDLSNCQPFQHQSLSMVHNGFIDRFRQTLHRPIRQMLSDTAYQAIHGSTDSEHMFGLFIDAYQTSQNLTTALKQTITTLLNLAAAPATKFSANCIVSDGQTLVASRFANRDAVPTLYWLQAEPSLPKAVLIASEPFFPGNWQAFPDRALLTVTTHTSGPRVQLEIFDQ